ncbi:MAG: Hsp20/alpha crystallin family protein [Gammaproteobacteria bacterium]|nr:Hsp20/alpha crystallin family protein [Gammaproteobacteria bacterium]
MALVRYEPWNLLNQFQKEVNRLFESRLGDLQEGDSSSIVTSGWRPAVDIKEEDNRFVILADVPGIDPKDIEVTMEDGVLTLKGERSTQTEEEREGYKRIERARGTFYRRFSLPDSADAEGIKAKGKDGVLEIAIPKHERVQPRRIAVQS